MARKRSASTGRFLKTGTKKRTGPKRRATTKRRKLALPAVRRKKAHTYRQGAKSSIRRKAKWCHICKGPHKPRHGLPTAKALLSKGVSPRRAKVIQKRRNAAAMRSGSKRRGLAGASVERRIATRAEKQLKTAFQKERKRLLADRKRYLADERAGYLAEISEGMPRRRKAKKRGRRRSSL